MGDYWYPFYPSRFKSATRHLTAEQDGIYRRLIDEYMETREPLPDNNVALARIAGVNENSILDAFRILDAFFTHKDGMLYHDYCDQMLDIQDKKAKRRSESAEKAAKKRWEKHNKKQGVKCDTDAEAMRGNATVTVTVTDTKKDIEDDAVAAQFEGWWLLYPKQRAGSKQKGQAAFLKALTRDTFENIMDGTQAYAVSDEVTRGYAKGAAAWLNDDRWKNQYQTESEKNENNRNYSAKPSKSDRAKAAVGRGIDSIPTAATADEGRPTGES